MTRLFCLPAESWEEAHTPAIQDRATRALEEDAVLVFSRLAFPLRPEEQALLSPAILGGAKNVSYHPDTNTVRGTRADGPVRQLLRGLLGRFAAASAGLLMRLCPGYTGGLRVGRTSFRPVEVGGRVTSWRKDDSRLHVDSFPSQPMRGQRILRVFCNINPDGKPRVWRIGGPFASVAARFWPALRPPVWGLSGLLYLLRITRAYRSAYDSYMLRLHDAMKRDGQYQKQGEQITHAFPPGCTWIVFTDQVPHAAMSGAHVLEQTFYVPVGSLANEQAAPLRVLEGLAGRKLA
ncbi:MAG: Kdo hydroxylase family protein [Gemmataceae bacterium]|nr:Kdo hydroxylase family protein [Gemmataceae bacterium]